MLRALAQRVVDRRVANQNRRPAVQHAVAHSPADVKPFALVGAHFEAAFLDRQQHAAVGVHRLNREIQNETEQLRQGPVACQFVTRANQRRDLRGGHARRIPLAVGPDHAFEVRDHRRRTGVNLVFVERIEDDHGPGRTGGGAVADDDQVTGNDPIARLQDHRRGHLEAIENRTVLAPEIAKGPLASLALNSQVLARKAVILREAEFGGAGAPHRDPFPLFQRHMPALAVGREYL